MDKIVGTIALILGFIMITYSLFIPTTVKKENTSEENITALRNHNLITSGFIIFIFGILIRQGMWEIK